MQELHSTFAAKGLLVVQAVPFNDSDWSYKDYSAATDYLILMAYDQHWTDSDSGPIAAQDWFEHNLIDRFREVDPAKTIVALGNYGYDWSDHDNDAREITFQEALMTARDSDDVPSFDSTISNAHFEYADDDQSEHSV